MAIWTASGEITFHQSKTFMDYLHGDVERGDAELACGYEYARESKKLWEAAKKRDELLREHPTCTCEKVVLAIISRNPMRGRPPWDWRFLMCRSFPTKDWNELSTGERKGISKRYETRPVPPLLMPDLLWTPQAGAMLDKFKELADANTPRIPNVPPGQEIPPILPVPAMSQKHGPVYWCLFEADFSESKNHLSDRLVAWFKQPAIERLWRGHKRQRISKRAKPLRARKVRRYWNAVYFCLFEVDLSARKGDLTKQFDKWLARPENGKRLKRYAKGRRGTTGQSLDRLKDLAAWRLYREKQNDCELANLFAKDNRKTFKTRAEIFATCKKLNRRWPFKPGEPRPFHSAKPGNRGHSIPANQADLFACDEDYRHAKMRVKEHLSELYPREFGKPSPAMKRAFERLKEFAQNR